MPSQMVLPFTSGAIIIAIPITLLFIFMQKYYVEGVKAEQSNKIYYGEYSNFRQLISENLRKEAELSFSSFYMRLLISYRQKMRLE